MGAQGSADLEADLRAALDGDVRFSDGDRVLYATDSSNYRQVPIGVVMPRHAEDVVRAVEVCRAHDAPILGRGAGTSLAGQCCNVAVVIDFSRYMGRILELDPDRRLARVEPGVVLDVLRAEAERHRLTFGPDPATHAYCTLGGMIGNNSCGAHSIMAGKTDENVEGLDILTYDGLRMRVGATPDEELDRIVTNAGPGAEIYSRLKALRDRHGDEVRARYPDIPRRVSGYNLNWLLPENGFHLARALVGSEGTCVVILEAIVRLIPSPLARSLLVLGYPDVYEAADAVPDVLPSGCIALEGFDDVLLHAMRRKRLHVDNLSLLPEGRGWLLVEFGGETREDADHQARLLMEDLRRSANTPSMSLYRRLPEQAKVWEIRESGLAGSVRVPGEPDTWEGWEDAAVPPARLGEYLRALRNLASRYGFHCPLYGHFGDGCVHNRMTFDLRTADGVSRFSSFIEEAADLVVSFGGSLSGEHGDGQSRAALLPKMFGNELVAAFGEFKSAFDPRGRMNPGKLVAPYRIDENLRLGTSYHQREVATHFRFPEDEGSFARAAERCVGVGKCRRLEDGVMCPSYLATFEEKHTTRGRAHLLFEMLRGDSLRGAWRETAVHEALDLCLACKGCKSDCPVNVDMATYKAEFHSHYYRGRLRPATAYSMGLIYWWARAASLMPGVVNTVTGAPVFSDVLKRAGGVAPERQVPKFASQTFTRWFRRRRPRGEGRPEVLLWPDTFTNHLQPSILAAAVRVLEAARFRVRIPRAPLCCGRPLYDFGMLPTAKRLLRLVLRELRPQVEAGIPIVSLEPSCLSVFRDELVSLFPNDEHAGRLARQSFTLAEFLTGGVRELSLPQLVPPRKAVVQTHCHQHAVMGFSPDALVMDMLGLDHEVPNSGCCGMAGSFGFERGDKYHVSVAVGERLLLPSIRQSAEDTLILADGFSCREQVFQGTGRRALHLAQVITTAIDEAGVGTIGAGTRSGPI